jgi:hypothetical protein
VNSWQKVFAIAAAFNFVVGAPLVIAPYQILTLVDSVPGDLLPARMAGVLIITFGIGYAMVAAQPEGRRDIVRLGVIGKSALVAMVAVLWLAGEVAPVTAAITCGDLLFAYLFMSYLRHS